MAGENSQQRWASASLTAAGYEVTVVIPCLNEAETVGVCVSKAVKTLGSLGIRGEVIVVDNGSSDGSVTVAERCGARVAREAQRGYGSALIRGIEEAKSPLIIMADADGSHDLAEIGPFIRQLQAGADLVMGTRRKGFIEPGSWPYLNQLGNLFFIGLVRLLFGRWLSDVNCGMRGFTKDAYRRMSLCAPGFEFGSEMVVKAIWSNLRIDEVPITHSAPGRGRPPHLRPFRDGWRHLKLILRLFATRPSERGSRSGRAKIPAPGQDPPRAA